MNAHPISSPPPRNHSVFISSNDNTLRIPSFLSFHPLLSSRPMLRLNSSLKFQSVNLASAHQVLDDMPPSDTFAWNHLIHTHLTDGDPCAALSVYLHMLLRGASPDRRTLPRVLNASRLSHNLPLGTQIHAQVFKLGFSSDPFIIPSLIHLYGRLDSTHSAQCLFDQSPTSNPVVSWTVLARLYLFHRKPHLALSSFFSLCHSNPPIPIDAVALATALTACGMLKSLHQGRIVHQIARQYELEFHILVTNSLLKMYIDCSSIQDARATFDEMPTRDIISWTEITSGYVKIGEFNESLKLFRQMNILGLKPDPLSISTILPACARPTAHYLGKQIHAYLLRNGVELESNLTLQNALMDMYVKSGFLESASKIFFHMKERDVISWTVMILGFSLHGHGEIGLQLFRRLEKDPGIEIDQFTYAAVLHCCTSACLVDEGKLYFRCIKEPNVTHYALMVSLLARAALFNEATAFIDEHKIRGHGEVLRPLLDGCRIHQEAKIAKQVIEQLSELEPTNAENYVLLSNWYAANAKWEMVDELKEMSKGMGLKTKKAYSWIEFRNKVHTFATGDISHPRSERIYEKIECLMKEMEVEAQGLTSLFSLHEERECTQTKHSEMLALCFGLISTQPGATIRVVKNHRMCNSCHSCAKIISKTEERELIVKDSYCFHHFKDGICSCRDFW